jgi:glutamyl-tRNA reductase
MLSGFYILHKKNPMGNEAVPSEVQATFKTCLRTIHFLWMSEGEDLPAQMEFDVYRGEKAYQFLLEVICGLHSPVVGETEVFGQFKTFLQNSDLDYPLAPLLSHAVVDTKRVRAQHLSDLGGQSYGSLVRKLLRSPTHVHFIGAGAFVQDLMPWIYKDENKVTVLARNLDKAQAAFSATYSRVEFLDLQKAKIESGVVIIAAPISAQMIEQIVLNPDLLVIDLRGESRSDECLKFSQYKNLSRFFEVIQENQQKVLQAKAVALKAIDEMTQQRLLVESFRPFGWDDICAW